MDEFTFWRLIKLYVTPEETKQGNFMALIAALIPLDEHTILSFEQLLNANIVKIMPQSDDFERSLLLDVPDIVLSVKSATIKRVYKYLEAK